MDNRIETICVQGGYRPGSGEPRQVPIIQSTTYKYDTSEEMGRLFDLEARADRLYALACPDPAAVPDAWRTGPVIVREGAG